MSRSFQLQAIESSSKQEAWWTCCRASCGDACELPLLAEEPWAPAELRSFPMMVMKMEDFLALRRMEPYQVLLKDERIREVPEDAVVHFISHEWLGCGHPDPEALQLRLVQRYFARMLRPNGHEEVFAKGDWTAMSHGCFEGNHAAARTEAARVSRRSSSKSRRSSSKSSRSSGKSEGGDLFEEAFEEVYQADIQEGYVWLDYASVPQICGELREGEYERTRRDQSQAIAAIQDYVHRSDYFYVVAPSACDEFGGACNYASWRRRGWCRLEEWANFLRPEGSKMPVIITEQPRARLTEIFDFVLDTMSKRELSVFNGAFGCCERDHVLEMPGGGLCPMPCDKRSLLPSFARMFDGKLAALREAGNDYLHRLLLATEPMAFAGSEADRIGLTCSPQEPVAAFLARLKLLSEPSALDNCGAPAIKWAAIMGHVPMVKRLLDAACRADVVDNAGLTPLHAAVASFCSEEVVAVLVDEGGLTPADVNRATAGMGITALHRAAKFGQPGAVRALLKRGAEHGLKRKNGQTALISAAEAGHLQVCELLLAARADVNAVDNEGRSGLHHASYQFQDPGNGSPNRSGVAQLLLRADADPCLKDNEGRTPLGFAVLECSLSCSTELRDMVCRQIVR